MHARSLAKAMELEAGLLNDYSARLQELQRIIGQRDWDVIARQRPGFLFRHDHRGTPAPGHRTVLFDLWHYDDPLVTFAVFFLEHSLEGWHTEVFPVRYRMWQREQVIDLMKQAGMPEVKTVACDWEVRFVAQRLA